MDKSLNRVLSHSHLSPQEDSGYSTLVERGHIWHCLVCELWIIVSVSALVIYLFIIFVFTSLIVNYASDNEAEIEKNDRK